MMILTIMMMKGEPNGYSNAKEEKVHLPMMMMITVRYDDDGGVGGGGGGDVGGDDGGSRGGSFADNNDDGGGSNGKEAGEPKVQFRIWSTPGIST